MTDKKSVFSSIRPYLTPPILISAALVLACIATAGAFVYVHRTPSSTSVVVARSSIVEEVDATGTVKPTESVDLGFQRSGTVSSIPVKVGSRVSAGQTLAALSSADLQASVEQAQANLASAQAKLASVQAGTRPEELQTNRAQAAQAINAAYIAADDAVHNKVDQFITNARTPQPTLNISSTDQQLGQSVLTSRVQLENTLMLWQSEGLSSSASSSAELLVRSESSVQRLLAVQTFLDMTASLLNKAIPTTQVPLSTIQGYQTAVGAGRTEVSQALSALNSAQGQLNVNQAGASTEDVQAAQAAVAAAQANVDAAKAQLNQTVIRAPIGGLIVRQDGNVGEVVQPGQAFISLNSDARFEIESYVSEVDVAKIAVGNSAQVRLDAYPNDTFPAAVVSVDPAAVMQQGSPAYKVTVQFTEADARVKAGLTANVSITSGQAIDAIIVPTSAIVTKGSSTYVLKVDAKGNGILTPVTIGISNPGGQTEVLSGLSQGETILSFGASAAN